MLNLPGAYPSVAYVPLQLTGFHPGETVDIHGQPAGVIPREVITMTADLSGTVRLVQYTGCPYCEISLPNGYVKIWGEGQNSGWENTQHFAVNHDLPVPQPVRQAMSLTITPRWGYLSPSVRQAHTYFTIEGWGFVGRNPAQNELERVRLQIFSPDGRLQNEYRGFADRKGYFAVVWVFNEADIPGRWMITLQDDRRHWAKTYVNLVEPPVKRTVAEGEKGRR